MSSMPTLNVVPLSGSEWVIAGASREQAPAPFTVALQSSEPARWWGLVLENGHEFAGQHVELKQRHEDWTGDVDIIVNPAGPVDRRSVGPGIIRAASR
jgi:hypothetical protein